MKLLLASAGIRNTSIHNALLDLLGKPIAEASALCIPTGTPLPPESSPLPTARSWHGGLSAGTNPSTIQAAFFAFLAN